MVVKCDELDLKFTLKHKRKSISLIFFHQVMKLEERIKVAENTNRVNDLNNYYWWSFCVDLIYRDDQPPCF